MWGTLSLMRSVKEERQHKLQPAHETAELNPARPETFIAPAHSVTENTTRSFEQVPRLKQSGSE